MRQWWTAVTGRRLFLALGTGLVIQQMVVGITEPDLTGIVVMAMAGVLGYGADRRRESSRSSSDTDSPSPSPSSPSSS